MNGERSTVPAFLVGLLLLAGCGERNPSARSEHPAAGVQESVLAKSQLPGATGVGAAMRLQDSAAARRAREDSLAKASP